MDLKTLSQGTEGAAAQETKDVGKTELMEGDKNSPGSTQES